MIYESLELPHTFSSFSSSSIAAFYASDDSQMASHVSASSVSNNALFILRSLVAISYLMLMLVFYSRAPAASDVMPRMLFKKAPRFPELGTFGDVLVSMLGPATLPFTIFVPSEAAFGKFSRIFQQYSEKGEKLDPLDTNSNVYAVLSHVLSFSTVPKPIYLNTVPLEREAEYDSLSGHKLSIARVPGRGLVVNNLTCVVTDLKRERFIIHILNGVLMDPEFARSMMQENEVMDYEEIKDGREEKDQNATDLPR